MNYKKIFKRETKVIAYVVICLTLVVIGTSYALFLQVNNNSNNQVVEAGSLTIEYSKENTTTADDPDDDKNCLAPKSNEEGKKNGCLFTFSITNNGTLPMQYNLLAHNDATANTNELLEYQYINYSLTKKNTKDESNSETISDGTTLNDAGDYTPTESEASTPAKKKILENAIIKPKESFSFSLRIWIDENAPTSIIGKKIDLALDVKGVVYEKEEVLADKVKIGDYVTYRPYQTSYVVSKDDTGYTEDQMINPSELTTWRVLQKNSDNTIDLISEYVSSTNITFKGITGYKNFVGALQKIASAYKNDDYISSTRHFGFNEQIEYLETELSQEVCGTSNTGTSGWLSNNESKGCGDTKNNSDRTLAKQIYGENLIAYKVGLNTASKYWSDSRYYGWNSTDSTPRWVNTWMTVEGKGDGMHMYKGDTESSGSASIRPIVTLKSGVKIADGDGTAEHPYVLSSMKIEEKQ